MTLTRRELLSRGTAAVVLASVGAFPKPAKALTMELLAAPLVLGDGASLVDKWYRPSPTFAGDSNGAMVILDGTNIRMSNFRLDTGFTTWQTPAWDSMVCVGPYPTSGICPGLSAVLIQSAPGLLMEQGEIEGFPGTGIRSLNTQDSISGGTYRNLNITHCARAMNFSVVGGSPPNPRNYCVKFQQIAGSNTWSAASHNGGQGDTMFNWSDLTDAEYIGCTALGTQTSSFKISGARRSQMSGCRGISLNIASDMLTGGHTDDLLIQGNTIDKNLGVSLGPDANGIYLQGTNVAPVGGRNYRIRILNNLLRCKPGDPLADGGHAIQLDYESYATIRGNIIEGWNGLRGIDPAYALARFQTSGTNTDFASTNTFINQTRIQTGPNTPEPASPFTEPVNNACRLSCLG